MKIIRRYLHTVEDAKFDENFVRLKIASKKESFTQPNSTNIEQTTSCDLKKFIWKKNLYKVRRAIPRTKVECSNNFRNVESKKKIQTSELD